LVGSTSYGVQRPDYISGTLSFFDPRRTDAVSGKPNSFFDGTGGGTATAATSPFFRRVGSGTSWAMGAGRWGNLGRNVFHGPGINNWDFAAFKRVKIFESHEVQFRTEFFNAFNIVQFGQPTANIASAAFGRITGYRDINAPARILQFSLRYQF
jgi:hypothetical protein